MVFADPWHGPSPAWDGVSDVGRANEEHLGQVKRHILSHADLAGILRWKWLERTANFWEDEDKIFEGLEGYRARLLDR